MLLPFLNSISVLIFYFAYFIHELDIRRTFQLPVKKFARRRKNINQFRIASTEVKSGFHKMWSTSVRRSRPPAEIKHDSAEMSEANQAVRDEFLRANPPINVCLPLPRVGLRGTSKIDRFIGDFPMSKFYGLLRYKLKNFTTNWKTFGHELLAESQPQNKWIGSFWELVLRLAVTSYNEISEISL